MTKTTDPTPEDVQRAREVAARFHCATLTYETTVELGDAIAHALSAVRAEEREAVAKWHERQAALCNNAGELEARNRHMFYAMEIRKGTPA